MENSNRAKLCLVAVTLVWVSTAGAGVGRRSFTPSDSILDFVDTQQVERMLAARRRDHTPPATGYVQRNELGTSDDSTQLVVSVPAVPTEPEEETELSPNMDFRKLLKSSKNALIVTKKDYLKEDWCKTEPLVQRIREPGCISVPVLNKFCYGQCNSFYIPKGPRRREGGDERPPPAFKSCSFCRPKKVSWVTVKLRCPGQSPPYKRKRLQKITACKCLPVGVN